MLNKVEYINLVSDSFSKFTQAGSYAQKINAVNSLLDVFKRDDVTTLDKVVACLSVAADVADGIVESGLFSKASAISAGKLSNLISFAKSSHDLVGSWAAGKTVDKNWYSLASSGFALIADVIDSIPIKNFYIEGVELFVRLASALSGYVATQLPDYQQLQIELAESLNSHHDIFNYQIDQSAKEAKSDFVSKVTAEASLVGMSYSELIQAVSSRWENQGLDGDFAATIDRFVERAKTESDGKYHAIKSKEVTETIEDYVQFTEQYIGEFDWISGEYSDVAFENILAISLRPYMDEVSAYVSEKLLEDFNDTLNDTNADISNNYSRKIEKEVELAPEDLGPKEEEYKEEVDQKLDEKKEQSQQEAQQEADNSEDNATLKQRLDQKAEDYKQQAEDAAKDTFDNGVALDAETVLINDAQQELDQFFNDIKEFTLAAEQEGTNEAECESTDDKIETAGRKIREQIDNFLKVDPVQTIAAGASDNSDLKLRLDALVNSTKANWEETLQKYLDAVEDQTDNEDPADCGDDMPGTGGTDNKPGFSNAESITSPLVIDLDGDGIETLGRGEHIYFDHDNNGLAENTGWVDVDDGLLVRDLNGDGQITNGTELFGNNTVLNDGTKARHGFEALTELDENSDTVIDSQDAAYSELRVWKDADSDGRVDEGELLTLEEAGISSLSTNWIDTSITDQHGNTVKQQGNATLADGSITQFADVWFSTDLGKTITVDRLELSAEIQALPTAKGFGNVHDLNQAMARDEVLQGLVQQFVDENSDVARKAMMNDLIYQWAGVTDVDPNSRDATRIYGHVMDARQLETLEELVGREYLGTWCWGQRDPNPHGRAAPVLIAQYEEFKAFVYGQLMAQSHYKDAFDLLGVTYDVEEGVFKPDTQAFSAYLEALADAGEIVEVSAIYGVLRDLGLFSSELDGVADQLNANPVLGPLLAENIISGGDGNDTLSGTAQEDLMIGGKGDDTLFGKGGNDTYLFELGDGSDRIYDSAGNDTLSFGAGLTSADMKLTRNATTLFITFVDVDGNPTGDRIQIDNIFDFDGSIREGAIENFLFDDGESLVLADLIPLIEQPVTDGDDTLYGTQLDDSFEALKGNDTIYGGAGDDTYRFALGDGMDTIFENAGTDTIEFTGGILPDQVKIVRTGPEGEDLLLKLYDAEGNETGDAITVVKAYQSYAASGNRIEQVSFTLADGSVQVMTLDDLEKIYDASPLDDVIYGFESDDTISALSGIDEVHGAGGNDTLMGDEDDDTLYGEAGDDLLIGGHGNDLLNGGSGDDTYFFASGDGHDVIDNRDSSSFDVLEFDSSVNPSKVRIFRVDNDLFISIDRNTDSVQVKNFFNGDAVSSTALKEIRFADGSVMTVQDVIDLTLEATQQADFITAFSSDDTIAARGGDDIVYAKSGDDMVSGDQGNDLLFGENGNDLLFGQQGADQIYGGQGDDVAYGGNEADQLYGSSGQDNLYGGNDGDLLYGGSQNDNLYGENGTDMLFGEHGDDVLNGGDGDDVLTGGVGNDIYTGGLGDDTYIYAQGDGDDLIETGKKEISGHDVLSLDGFSTDQVWLSQQGDDLLVNFVGNNGQVLIEDWALDHDVIDEIQVDGFSASGEDIERLVSAMAAFDAPSGAGEVLTQDVKDQLQPVLAASWHSAA